MINKQKISGDVLQGLRACSYAPCALIIRSYLCVVMEHFDFEIKKLTIHQDRILINCLFFFIISELGKSVYSEN